MKMKKKILSAAVLAALGAGSAQAVNLSTDGTGEVLVFPYFTVQGNEETLLSIVNTTNEGKVVKVRFREAYNTQEVLDFHVYLSPYDVWVAKIQDSADGGAEVYTPDNSCTTMDTNPQPFSDALFGDTGPTTADREREGYFTAIEIARIVDMDLDGNGQQDYVHVNGTPDNCNAIRQAWLNGTMLANSTVDQPTGGLMGTLSIINVQSGTEVSVPATVLENFLDNPQHVAPGSLRPDWQDAFPRRSDVIVSDSAAGTVSIYSDAWTTGEDAVSAVLMASAVMNEYTVNPEAEASTAWVVTFPTKSLYVNPAVAPFTATAPFTHTFAGDTDGDGVACEEIGMTIYDREEGQLSPDGSLVSPPPIEETLSLCYEANVIQFGDTSDVFSAANTEIRFGNSALPGTAGWAKMSFTAAPHTMTSVNGTVYTGLPVIGFKATVLGNSNVGVGASYAAAVNHAYERSIVGTPAFTVGGATSN